MERMVKDGQGTMNTFSPLKRGFKRLLALSVMAAVAGGCARPAPPAKRHVNIRGLYLTGYSAGNSQRFEETIRFMKRKGLNAMVIDAKDDSGKISWQTDIPLALEIGANQSKIKNIRARVQTLLANDIYPIARVVVFADPLLGSRKPQWSIRTKDGAQFRDVRDIAWPSPHRQEVWQYNVEVARRAAQAGFKEIQFDYVRFPETRIDGVNWNASLKTSDAIEEFLRYARRQLEPYGVFVSADIFGQTSSKTRAANNFSSILGQDYKRIADIVDYVFPMVYPSHYAPGSYGVKDPNQKPGFIVRSALLDARKRTPHLDVARHRPWLQDFDLDKDYTARDVEDQIKGLAQAGVHQWVLWNARNRYTPNVNYNIGLETKNQPAE